MRRSPRPIVGVAALRAAENMCLVSMSDRGRNAWFELDGRIETRGCSRWTTVKTIPARDEEVMKGLSLEWHEWVQERKREKK